ncbi:MAG: hypothetical protein A3F35_02110 [Candidatus Woykebacteria bacterium RIFCSPHIGHO2_12_FULL_45_10]|uniref:UDP-N-acetylmuramate--L-alanine ligase n=1 Tax=Candidatus Woykebacteria bacterium RIFCSPHIGHO2_12_FULL_45_10 TaxID=1802603 RepID=A0A1G1WMC6_9BACT|nr:MAG: hypothetical protein A3F35_02110 [Candidatus Woykebacteria bacterium RIFCSPHIGHO2_12_FULL_45_10]
MTKKIHFSFAGGAAVSAVAALAAAAGYEVSACEKLDPKGSFFVGLRKSVVACFDTEDVEHLNKVEILVVSAGTKRLDPGNLEVRYAKESGIEILTAEEFLTKRLLKDKFVVAIAGTNGKSTTTAMIGKILEEAGLDPSVFVGAIVPEWGSNYRAGRSKYFVVEADEYLDKFLLYRPNVEVITNIEYDHPDYFSDKEAVQKSFEKFATNLAKDGQIFLGPTVKLETNKQAQHELQLKKLDLKIPGEFNEQNAALAFQTAVYLGVAEKVAQRTLERFGGAARRFEFKGEEKGVKVFDDYAHHPTAVGVTLKAASDKFPNSRIWCVFQMHTYTRLQAMFPEFVEAFSASGVDEKIFLPVFGSREAAGEVSVEKLAREVKGAKFMKSQDEAATYITKGASFGDVVLLMGAGDIVQMSALLLRKLKNKG